MTKYIDPFSDTGFKFIFGREGQSEEVLRFFLNEVLRGQPMFEEIMSVKFINNERTRSNEGDKTIIHDVMCTTDKGHRFIVEMQSNPQRQFLVRAIYYVARGVTDQSYIPDAGEWRYDFMPVVGTFISRCQVDGLPEKVLTHIGLADLDTGQIINSHIRFAFIQANYFNKKADECANDFERMLFILKNMSTLEEIPFTEENKIYKQMDELARYAALSPEERRVYDYELKQTRDRNCELDTARDMGIAEGRAEGITEGEQRNAIAVARRMLARGLGLDMISDISGLSIGEIEAL